SVISTSMRASRLVGLIIATCRRRWETAWVPAVRKFLPLARPVHCGPGGEHLQLADAEMDACFEGDRIKRQRPRLFFVKTAGLIRCPDLPVLPTGGGREAFISHAAPVFLSKTAHEKFRTFSKARPPPRSVDGHLLFSNHPPGCGG